MEHDALSEPWIDEHNIKPVNENILRVYWIAFWVNLSLGCFKISVGALGYSRLLLIDGLNSSANAVAVTIILFGVCMSQPHAVSCRYPNGKGKAQYVITLIFGFLLAAGAGAMLGIAIKSFFYPISHEPVDVGISVALISIMANLLLLRYLKQTGSFYEKDDLKTIINLQSLNIGASIVVGNSLLLSGVLGWVVVEHIGSISISLIVLWLSLQIIKKSLDGVMDRSCGHLVESRLTALAYSVDDVKDVRFLRTRRAGQVMMIDLQLCLDGALTISQSDKIVAEVKKRLAADLKDLAFVITIDRRPAG